MAIDKAALAAYRRVVKPLTAFTPEGIFPGYPQPSGDPFDPARARALLAEAGYRDAAGRVRSVDVPARSDRAQLQHHGEQPPDRRVRAGAVEAEPGPDRAPEEHGVEDVPRPARQARVPAASRAPAGSATTWTRTASSTCSPPRPATTARAGRTRSTWPCCVRPIASPIHAGGTSCSQGRGVPAGGAAGHSALHERDRLAEEAVRQGDVREPADAPSLEVRLHRARPRQVGLLTR